MAEKAVELSSRAIPGFFNTLGYTSRLNGRLPEAVSAHRKVFELASEYSYPYLAHQAGQQSSAISLATDPSSYCKNSGIGGPIFGLKSL